MIFTALDYHHQLLLKPFWNPTCLPALQPLTLPNLILTQPYSKAINYQFPLPIAFRIKSKLSIMSFTIQLGLAELHGHVTQTRCN